MMKYTALIGKPTEHSVSHIMYGELVKAAGINSPYAHIKVDTEKEHLKSNLKAFDSLGFSGINVTLPHKMAVIPLLDETHNVVDELGAVNTIKFGKKITGYNTDWLGIYKPIISTGNKISIVTIFGTGGAARAAVYAARMLKAQTIYVHYRSKKLSQNTEDLMNKSKDLGITMRKYGSTKATISESDLIINATSAGMVGKDELPFELNTIEGVELSNKIFLDAVFNPLRTPLLEHFDSRGAKTIDGLWMMIYQGIAALEVWFDQEILISDKELNNIHDMLRKELNHV